MSIGQRVITGVCIVAMIGLVVITIADLPPASYINHFQAWLLGGSYYPQLTMILLLFAVLLPCAAVAAIYRLIVGAGDQGQMAVIAAKLSKRPFEGGPPDGAQPPARGPNEGIEKP